MTNRVGDIFICGIGLNTKFAPRGFAKLDVLIDDEMLLQRYVNVLKSKVSWKDIFSKFAIEFHKSKKFSTHIFDKKIVLDNATLAEDGALVINGERIYSLR